MAKETALNQAIKLLIAPGFARAMRASALPADVSVLLHILARDEEAEQLATRVSGRPLPLIREAAEFYAEQVFFAPGGSAYRTLAAEPGASREELRANLALLLRWLHPDRGIAESRTANFLRVTHAWDLLGSPQRRADYDARSQRPAVRRGKLRTPKADRAPVFVTSRTSARQRYSRRRARVLKPWFRRGFAISAVGVLLWFAWSNELWLAR